LKVNLYKIKKFRELFDCLKDFQKRFSVNLYLVGGFVRNFLLNQEIKDIDIVIDKKNISLLCKFILKHFKKKFRLAGPIVFPRFNTFRLTGKIDIELVGIDTEKSAYLKCDAELRDFTINALYLEFLHCTAKSEKFPARILDPTCKGISDLKNQIIDTPISPVKTIKFDPIRLLRAIRFSIFYNFKISARLYSAIKKNAHLINDVAKERVKEELIKILSKPAGLELLFKLHLNKHIFKGLTYPFEDKKLFNIMLNSRLTPLLRISILCMHNSDKKSKCLLKSLKFSNKEIKEILFLKNFLEKKLPIDKKSASITLYQLKDKLGKYLVCLTALAKVDNKIKSDFAKFKKILPTLDKNFIYNIKPLNGKEICSILKITPGPIVGKIKSALIEALVSNKIENSKKSMEKFIKKLYEEIRKTKK